MRPIWGLAQVRGEGEREIARIAGLQHGLVAREQLFAAGLSRGALEHRLTNARLFLFHPGVYLLGRPFKGAANLRAALQADTGYTESDGERKMFALLRAAGLPLPVTQVPLLGYRVDFLWPAQRLVVEVDGFDFHGDRAAFERDRARDQVLVAAGFRVVRITYRQLRDHPYAVMPASRKPLPTLSPEPRPRSRLSLAHALA